MKIIKRSSHGYPQDPTKTFGFEEFEGMGNPDLSLIVAAFDTYFGCWKQFDLSVHEIEEIKKKKVVRLEFEEPNKFFIRENFETYDEDFWKVFTLCPYTAEYLNKQQGRIRRVPIFFPFNKNYIPIECEKIYDIIYTGHLVAKPIIQDIRTIRNYNYRLVSNSKHSLVTNHSVGYDEKIRLISQSRITLVHNLLYPSFQHLRNIWSYSNWQSNGAFSELPQPRHAWEFFVNRAGMVVPQLKSRLFEAAFSRSLILCKRDPFNIIEHFFDPGKEFVYFEEGSLRKTVSKILSSYNDYKVIIDAAFERASEQYTTEVFFKKFLRDI
jgi:hypothetical protein